MTVAVAVKVFDGIVLAADSATTLPLQNGSAQVYNNANKIFQLHRDLPVGAMTWGLGNIGSASIATLAKDFRRRLMGKDPASTWQLDADTYTVEQVVDRMVEMFFDELYAKVGNTAALGLLVVGYSAGAEHGEAWEIQLDDPTVRPVATLVMSEQEAGWRAYGQPEAVGRLFNGVDPFLLDAIRPCISSGTEPQVAQALAMVERNPAVAPMPLADAIKLARYMVDTTIGYSKFLLGPNSVGGAVDVAGISRHEGFKWIRRKHYYPGKLNPRRPHEHDL